MKTTLAAVSALMIVASPLAAQTNPAGLPHFVSWISRTSLRFWDRTLSEPPSHPRMVNRSGRFQISSSIKTVRSSLQLSALEASSASEKKKSPCRSTP